MDGLSLFAWILTGFLAAVYLVVGALKTISPAKAQASSPTLQAQLEGRVRFIGVMEILGAAGLILPVALNIQPWLAALAAFGLALIQALAISEHIKAKDTSKLGLNIVLLLLALNLAVLRVEFT